MPRERTYTDVLNLRVDEALSREIKRIAGDLNLSESETARQLITWGIQAARSAAANDLLQPYTWPAPEFPRRMQIRAEWIEVDPEDEPGYR